MPNVTVEGVAKAIEKTANAKLGKISTTYASIESCPNACPFKTTGACYGMAGPISWVWNKLNKRKVSTLEVAKAEAKAIDSLSGKRDLRLHTLGDCSTNETAKIVSDAAGKYMEKGDKTAFTYTHGWREVARESWGKVSVLASCETAQEVKEAAALGYATSMVVSEFKDTKAYEADGLKVVPCPEMTGKAASCEKCRLCMRDGALKTAGVTIAFAAHGTMVKRTKAVLGEKNG